MADRRRQGSRKLGRPIFGKPHPSTPKPGTETLGRAGSFTD
jgi:hypothetical protein